MKWKHEGITKDTLLLLQLSSVLRLWAIICTTFVQLTLLLHDWTILRIYDATVRRLSVLFHTTVRFYGSLCFYMTGQFYASPMLLYAVSVLFYTTARFYASTFLWLTLLLHHWMILHIYDATIRRLSVLFYTTQHFYMHLRLTLLLHVHDWKILWIYDATIHQVVQTQMCRNVQWCKTKLTVGI